MATEKILNTRIINKHALLSEWDSSSLPLKDGEIALAKVTVAEQHTDGKISEVPAYLVKVGTGDNKTFKESAWAYAKAADVYAWAKAATKPTYAANEITGLQEFVEGISDIDTDLNTKYSFEIPTSGDNKDKLVITPNTWSLGVEGTDEEKIILDLVTPDKLEEILEGYVKSVSKNDGTAIEVDNTDPQNPKVGFKIAATQGDKVTVTQSNDGLKVEVDQTHNHDDEYSKIGHKHTSDDITDFDTAVAAIKVASATNADTAANATKLEGKTTEEIKAAFTGTITNNDTGFVTGDAVYDVKVVADDAKSKIDTFLASVTPDGADNIIDTLQEINDYVGEHGEAFATLSNKVTNIENGTTTVPKAVDADKVDGLHAQDLKDYADSAVADFANAIEQRNYVNEGYVNSYVTAALQNIEEDFTNQAYTNKTLVALTQTDGRISATFQDIAITKSQITDFSDDDYAKPGDIGNGKLAITTESGVLTGSVDFTANQKTDASITIGVAAKGITTAKIADHAVGAAQIKAEQSYTGEDAEVWVFDCGGAE